VCFEGRQLRRRDGTSYIEDEIQERDEIPHRLIRELTRGHALIELAEAVSCALAVSANQVSAHVADVYLGETDRGLRPVDDARQSAS